MNYNFILVYTPAIQCCMHETGELSKTPRMSDVVGGTDLTWFYLNQVSSTRYIVCLLHGKFYQALLFFTCVETLGGAWV